MTYGPAHESGEGRSKHSAAAGSPRRPQGFHLRMSRMAAMPADHVGLLSLQGRAGNKAVAVALQRSLSVQRSNPADPRLPLDQAEALRYATADQVALTAALARLATAADLARKNVPDAVRQWSLVVEPLTPRHDSPVGAPLVSFFAGTGGYATSVIQAPSVDHHLDTAAGRVRVRARQQANVDNVLATGPLEDRVFSAVSVAAHHRGGPSETFYEQYRGEFNARWDVAPYNTMSPDFDPNLDSRGPATSAPGRSSTRSCSTRACSRSPTR